MPLLIIVNQFVQNKTCDLIKHYKLSKTKAFIKARTHAYRFALLGRVLTSSLLESIFSFSAAERKEQGELVTLERRRTFPVFVPNCLLSYYSLHHVCEITMRISDGKTNYKCEQIIIITMRSWLGF